MQQRQLDRLPNLLDLLLQTTDIRVRLRRSLVELHHANGRVGIIGQNADDTDGLVMKENTGTGLKQVLVNEAHDAHVVLGAGGAGHDGVVVIDHLLQRTDAHGAPSHVVDAATFVGIAVCSVIGSRWGVAILRSLGLPQALLVLDVFLLEQQVVVDALHAQEAQFAPLRWVDGRELRSGTGARLLSLLATDAGGGLWRWLVLWLILLDGWRSSLAGLGDLRQR